MRSFIADEPFEPVEKLRPPSESATLPDRYQPVALLTGGVVFIAFSIWVLFGVDGANRLFGAFVMGASGALAIAAARVLRLNPGRPLKSIGNLTLIHLGTLVLILLTGESVREAGLSGSMGLGLFTLAWIAISLYIAARARREREVAALMRGRPSPAPSNEHRELKPAADAPALLAPSIRVDIYLQDDLPALTRSYLTPVGADRNILGLRPQRILYLYNFFSPETLMHKLKGNWRRFGPVYFLGSPADFGYNHAFRHVGADVATTILPTPDSFDTRLAGAPEAVLPPGDQNLTDISYLSGGYPQHLFLCSDGSWRHGVERLFAHADIVLLDACEYDTQRAGLNWEIGQLVDRVDTRNVVVFVDKSTDQAALCAAFRTAWRAMDGSSPNNRADAGPVRWVLLESLNEREPSRELPPLPPEADPHGLYAKLNPWPEDSPPLTTNKR